MPAFPSPQPPLTAETLLRMIYAVAQQAIPPSQAATLRPFVQRLLDELNKLVEHHGPHHPPTTDHAPEGWSLADY